MSHSSDGPKLRIALLREATADQHKELDGLITLMREDVTREYYAKVLSLFYGFLMSFEEGLFAHEMWSEVLPGINERRKLQKLENDLIELSVVPERVRLCSAPPPTQTFAQALGVMYVMEGSTLGGQMMSRHLCVKFPELSHRYMSGYGEATGKNWQQFLKALESVHLTEEQESEMKKAAQATFSNLKSWFTHF